jgi:hypothetical protein
MPPETLLSVLCALERELQSPGTRRDANRLNQLLHPGFREFGRSGSVYARTTLIGLLTNEEHALEIHAEDFRVQSLAEGVALLTYKSAEASPDGSLERPSLRSSLWLLAVSGWQLAFHQGTPTEPFDRCEDNLGVEAADPSP